MNAVWLELVGIERDLLAWSKALLLGGELSRSEPKRLLHRLLHVAARLAFSGRRAKLRLQRSWPWAGQPAAFAKLRALRAPPAETSRPPVRAAEKLEATHAPASACAETASWLVRRRHRRRIGIPQPPSTPFGAPTPLEPPRKLPRGYCKDRG